MCYIQPDRLSRGVILLRASRPAQIQDGIQHIGDLRLNTGKLRFLIGSQNSNTPDIRKSIDIFQNGVVFEIYVLLVLCSAIAILQP